MKKMNERTKNLGGGSFTVTTYLIKNLYPKYIKNSYDSITEAPKPNKILGKTQKDTS